MKTLMTDEKIRQYAESNGYLEVWRSWRDHMLAQGRDVPEKRMQAETLPQNDIELDTAIAYDVVRDFVSWLACPICQSEVLPTKRSYRDEEAGQGFIDAPGWDGGE